MRLIPIETAVTEIERACQSTTSPPFFFITGAGVSSPPIPMAREIVQLCKEKVRDEGRTAQPVESSAMNEYSFWFQEAYPQPFERPLFLRSLMQGKPLSRANWRLAHLLSGRQVANVVVTPNFDDMLSRALFLLGIPHVLCDHPVTASRIDEDSSEIQILHVHGTYRFYDCCNLSDEIANRAQQPSPLSSKLDALLSRKVPLVVGYSGWGEDVIMQALKRRLDGQNLPRNLYWFCYNRSTIESLPDWIRNHVNVRFVVPPEPIKEAKRELVVVGTPRLPSAEDSLVGIVNPHLSGQTVFDSLIQACKVEAPQLTCDPLGVFAARLRELIIEEEGDEEDPYFLHDVVDRIERAKQLDNQYTQESQKEIEAILNLLRNTEYENASQAILSLSLERLSLTQIEKLSDAVNAATSSIEDKPEIELLLYRETQRLMQEWLRRNDLVSEGSHSDVEVDRI